MLRLSFRCFVGGLAAALVAGCGGNVLMEAAGGGGGSEGGSGGGGSTGSTTPPGTTTTPPDPTGSGGGPGEVTPACLEYCDAVANKPGCSDGDDCHARCMSLYASGCTAEAETVLGCVPQWLSDVCQIGYPPFGPGCQEEIDDLWDCGASWLAGCKEFGNTLITVSACDGHAVCGGTLYQIECDEAAQCKCLKDGEVAGACEMPFTGAEACSPTYTCCRPFFEP